MGLELRSDGMNRGFGSAGLLLARFLPPEAAVVCDCCVLMPHASISALSGFESDASLQVDALSPCR